MPTPAMPAENASIQDAKHYLRANWEKGCKCPACGQFVKLYKRKITGVMALALVELYKKHQRDDNFTEFVHFADLLQERGYGHAVTNTGDLAKLKYWRLIEPQIDVRDDGSTRVGRYRITLRGVQFVKGEISVPERVGLFNQLKIDVECRDVFIRDVWANKFDYNELMGV